MAMKSSWWSETRGFTIPVFSTKSSDDPGKTTGSKCHAPEYTRFWTMSPLHFVQTENAQHHIK